MKKQGFWQRLYSPYAYISFVRHNPGSQDAVSPHRHLNAVRYIAAKDRKILLYLPTKKRPQERLNGC